MPLTLMRLLVSEQVVITDMSSELWNDATFLGSTNRKELLSWRYNTNCSYCVQRSPSLAHIETITYSEYYTNGIHLNT